MLKGRMAELRERIMATDSLEVFTAKDLLEGRWPRKEAVPEDQRDARMRSLGVQTDGFLIRAVRDGKTSFRMSLNPVGANLAVQGFFP